ncbi:MAG: hypothetical protein ACC656_05360 [Candidatus Heimdallarchaeota archaeon]
MSYDPADLGIKIAEEFTSFSALGLNFSFEMIWIIFFLLQNVMVFLGFSRVNSKEDKYLLFPEDESGQQKYHYFTPDQLLIFIELTANEITGAEKSYSKIYITREPRPRMFSYFLFGKRTIVLNPTILQIATTQELRASLAIDLELTKSTSSSLVRIYSSQHSNFFFIPFYGAIIPFIREILILFNDSEKTSNPLQYLLLFLFLIISLFMIMSFVKKIVAIFINSSNRNLVKLADLEAAELVGAKAVINSLLKIGQRSEAIEIILDEMQYLEELERGKLIETLERGKLIKLVQKFPIASIDHDAALQMAPKIFITQKLEALEKIYHCKFANKEKIINDSVEDLLQKRLAFIKKWKKNVKGDNANITVPTSVDYQIMLDDCIKFDEIDIKKQLKDDEIQILVDKICEKPRKKLFVHEPKNTPIWNTHPTIADRIITVNKLEFRG